MLGGIVRLYRTGAGVKKLPSLQVLRAFAAIGVVSCHVWGAALYTGSAGVDLFFVISGFVMVYSSDHLFGKGSSVATFVSRRIIRIVPLYWAFVATILYIGFPATNEEILKSLFFIPYLSAWKHWQPIGFVGWTLNYEMFFYAIFAAAIVLPRRQAVAATVGTIVLLTISGRLFALDGAAAYLTSPIILEFAFGCTIGLLYLEGFRVPRSAAFAFILLAVGAFCYLNAPLDLVRPFVWGLPSAAIVAGACLVKEPWSIGDIGKPLYVLGNASYALYLTHMQLFGFTVEWGIPRAMAFWLLIAFAVAVYFVFEKPVMYLARYRARTRPIIATVMVAN